MIENGGRSMIGRCESLLWLEENFPQQKDGKHTHWYKKNLRHKIECKNLRLALIKYILSTNQKCWRQNNVLNRIQVSALRLFSHPSINFQENIKLLTLKLTFFDIFILWKPNFFLEWKYKIFDHCFLVNFLTQKLAEFLPEN